MPKVRARSLAMREPSSGARGETPPPDAPNELAPRVPFAASVAARNGANSWRVFLPPRHAEGCAFDIGGGKALRVSRAIFHARSGSGSTSGAARVEPAYGAMQSRLRPSFASLMGATLRQAHAPPPPVAKAQPSTRRGGRMERHGLRRPWVRSPHPPSAG